MHEPLPKEEMFVIDQQEIVMSDFDLDFDTSGYILDIGGGGEGTIGILKGEKVIAIDTRREELEEAPEGPVKIVMDATTLQFLDNAFDTVTSFFTLMYISKSDHTKVFKEVYRVLTPGGHFLIWDVVIPPRGDQPQEWFVVPVSITVNDKTVQTGYGVRWKDREQDILYYEDLAAKTGFEVLTRKQGQTFYLQLRKRT
jgi:ubiquinone/menaquinone biosynthesis C-methylase UbiE